MRKGEMVGPLYGRCMSCQSWLSKDDPGFFCYVCQEDYDNAAKALWKEGQKLMEELERRPGGA